MRQPVNALKAALRRGEPQIGLWLSLADAYVAELVAGTGFDWLLIDGEHAPNDLRSVLAQLQAIAAYPVSAVVRPVQGDSALIKQYLDLGVQTLLVPMVHSAEQARSIVAATRYPPRGIRGVGGDMSRVTRWSGVDDYVATADAEICVFVQAESAQALDELEGIAAVDGVDGVFFGPADLSASMGLTGQPGHPLVRAAIESGMATVRAAGKAAGIIATDRALAQHYLDSGALFVAVGVEAGLLVGAARDLAAAFRRGS